MYKAYQKLRNFTKKYLKAFLRLAQGRVRLTPRFSLSNLARVWTLACLEVEVSAFFEGLQPVNVYAWEPSTKHNFTVPLLVKTSVTPAIEDR